MDRQGRFSISARKLHSRLGAATAPLLIEVRRAALPLLMALVLGGGWAAVHAQTGPTEIDISHYAPGPLPPDFLTSWHSGNGSAGTWAVVEDETARKGKAIAQTSTDATDYRFPLAVYEPFAVQNVEVVIRFKPVSGKVDRAGGIAIRLTSADNYYVVRANALEDNVRFYRVVKGNREQIAGVNTKVTSGDWHTLALRAEGDRFTVSFDGKQLFTASDRTFPSVGKIALWTKADSVTHFDRIVINPLQ
ncbi:MAG TPA: family 16 glycoside hydrolase [Stellaceae bacterium]|jgi:hypothetical protein